MRNLILVSVVIGGMLLYLLSSSSANTEVFSLNYYSLLGLTGALALYLMGLVGCATNSQTRYVAPNWLCGWCCFSR